MRPNRADQSKIAGFARDPLAFLAIAAADDLADTLAERRRLALAARLLRDGGNGAGRRGRAGRSGLGAQRVADGAAPGREQAAEARLRRGLLRKRRRWRQRGQ